jgi:hypothetical protein
VGRVVITNLGGKCEKLINFIPYQACASNLIGVFVEHKRDGITNS